MSLNFDYIVRELVKSGDEIAKAGADELANQLRKNLTRKSGTPSKPGEYPAKQSGDLEKSVKVERQNIGGGIAYTVSVDTEYAERLEQIRPYFFRTISESQKKIEGVMRRVANRRGLK